MTQKANVFGMADSPKVAPVTKPVRSLLVVPFGATNPRSGGGQRTAILFEALRSAGPTTVAYITGRREESVSEFFPGAARVETIVCSRYSPPKGGFLGRVMRLAEVVIAPWRQFKPEKGLSDGLDRLRREGDIDLVAFRYCRGFLNGHGSIHRNCHIFVDVDDRDDHRLLSNVAQRIGTTAARLFYAPYLRMTVLPKLKRNLAKADIVFFSKSSDVLDVAPAQSEVWPNVPHISTSPDFAALPSAARNILFVASIDHKPNQYGILWFMTNCWPEIAKNNPDVRLRLVGIGDWKPIKLKFSNAKQIDFLGYVDNIEAEYEAARIVICPIFSGAGSQIKVIEALSFARPVVCSNFSANGFGANIRRRLIVATNRPQFLSGCQYFLDNPAVADAVGASLRLAQETAHTKSAVVKQLRQSILTACQSIKWANPPKLGSERNL